MALETTPNTIHYHANAAVLYTIQEDWEQAIATHKHVLEIDPDYAEAHRSLARLYSHLEQLELELHHWYEFLTLRPELGTPERNFKLGKSFQEHGNLELAAVCYERVIERNDQYWTAYYNLADVRSQQQQWEQVAACYEQVIDKDATQVQAFHKLGQHWLQQKDYDQAIASFREATKVDPNFPWAYRGLVQTFMELKRWDEAIATCRAIIGFVEEYPWAYTQMGKASMQKGDEMQAIDFYRKGFQLQGWEACAQRGYQFTQDNFSHQIPSWTKSLHPVAHQEQIKALEIGSGQGLTACWLLDNILSQASSQLTCLDRRFSSEYRTNINHSQVANNKVQQLEGQISTSLKSLDAQAYHIAVIQDPLKQAKLMEQNTRLCWPLLTSEAIVIFPSYGWKHPKDPAKSPKVGIDQFLASVEGQFEILHKGYQLIIRRNGDL